MSFLTRLAVKYGLKALLYLGIFLAVSGTALGVYKHIELIGEHKILASEKAATDAESVRRLQVISEANKRAQETDLTLSQKDQTNAQLQAQIDHLASANHNKPCLDLDSVRRIRSSGQTPSGGAKQR